MLDQGMHITGRKNSILNCISSILGTIFGKPFFQTLVRGLFIKGRICPLRKHILSLRYIQKRVVFLPIQTQNFILNENSTTYMLIIAERDGHLHRYLNSGLRKITLSSMAKYYFSGPAQKIPGKWSPFLFHKGLLITNY